MQCWASEPKLRETLLPLHSRPTVGLLSRVRLVPIRRPLSSGMLMPAPTPGEAVRPRMRSSDERAGEPEPDSISRKPSTWLLRMMGSAVVLLSLAGTTSGAGACASADEAAMASRVAAMGRSSGSMMIPRQALWSLAGPVGSPERACGVTLQ